MKLLAILLALSLHAQTLELVPHALPAPLEHFPSPQKFYPETMAGGLALFDYNNDGLIDVFLPGGADLTTNKKSPNRLFRNDGNFHFTDVTQSSGLSGSGSGFAFGAAVADFDGDGFLDLYVPALPQGQLFRNRGNGTFEDVSSRLPQSSSWIVAAGWFDYDRDGRPDLFLVHYLNWSLTNNPWCGDRAKDLRVYCHPRQFAPLANQLLHNLGNGKFEDVSQSSGIAAHKGKGMSVAFGDANNDGFPDAFVTNDTLPAFLFLNQRNGTFKETALDAGVSLPESGRAISGMGTVFADFNNDGHDDITLTALARETFPLYQGTGKAQFTEVTDATQLAAASTRYSGWGIALADLDNDGFPDLLTANSHVNDTIELTSADKYKQPNTLFRNLGGKRFTPIPFGPPRAHRGLAVADLNNDGLLDVVITVLGTEPEVWRNTTAPPGNWLEVSAPLGTVLKLGNQKRTISTATGYSTSVAAPAHFGLGSSATPVTLHITWPNGTTAARANIPPNQRLVLKP